MPHVFENHHIMINLKKISNDDVIDRKKTEKIRENKI